MFTRMFVNSKNKLCRQAKESKMNIQSSSVKNVQKLTLGAAVGTLSGVKIGLKFTGR